MTTPLHMRKDPADGTTTRTPVFPGGKRQPHQPADRQNIPRPLQLCQPLGLTNLTSTHLINILRRPGMSQNELACLLSVSKVMVSKTLKQLEQEGLITRIPDQEDKRLVHLYVTPRGEELAQESIAIQREITCLAASTLTQEECICVENKLNEVLEHLSSLMEKNR